jgi:hypothetical protein
MLEVFDIVLYDPAQVSLGARVKAVKSGPWNFNFPPGPPGFLGRSRSGGFGCRCGCRCCCFPVAAYYYLSDIHNYIAKQETVLVNYSPC